MKILKTLIIICSIGFILYTLFFKGFYEYSSDGDLKQIPLIEPIVLNSLKNDDNWFIQGKYTNNLLSDINGIDSIGLVQNYILLHCSETNGIIVKYSGWCIFDISTKKLFWTKSYSDFILNLKMLSGNSIITLYDPNLVYKSFKQNNKLPIEWEPYELKYKRRHWWIIKYWLV
jgi:hypothetical protein